MSCEVNTIWKENMYDQIIEEFSPEENRDGQYKIIDELLESTVWRQADPELIPELQADTDTLILALVEKRFWQRGH